jgi:hypothetical protein
VLAHIGAVGGDPGPRAVLHPGVLVVTFTSIGAAHGARLEILVGGGSIGVRLDCTHWEQT